MKKKNLFVMALLLMASMAAQAGKIVTDSVSSLVLGATVKYNVYLPTGFEGGTKQYPVVYLLHGLTDDYTAWQEKGDMQAVADELIESGEACEMVIVMPCAGGPDVYGTWNGYFNMPGWNYEDFFFQEFMPAVEQKYRVIADKQHRAVMGLSMGGGGSTVYGQRYPGLFSSVYAMSAWLDSDEGEQRQPGVDDKMFLLMNAVKERSALRFVEEADDAAVEQLRTVKWFFDCGDDDILFDQSVEIYRLMRAKRIKSELRIRNGRHSWEYWHQSLRMALPFASGNFGR